VLVATCAVRYLSRHGLDSTGVLILIGAAGLAVIYSGRSRLPDRTWWPATWVGVVVLLWAALTMIAPSFAWCAVPIAFAVLRVIRFPFAVGIVVLMTLVVTGSWIRISHTVDPTLVAGPIGIALATVLSYRALDRQSRERQRLLDELTAAQADLAEEQQRTGALAERTRLSREIHDSVGQGLSSINLLLNAAEQEWTGRPDAARDHVRTAAATAREGLDEVRRVVSDLAPDTAGTDPGTELADQLRRAAGSVPGLDSAVRIHGSPVPLRPDIAAALVRTARGALANVAEHADARRVAVTLTYNEDEVLLDVRDDGRGFEVDQIRPDGVRGRGLRGITDRATALGGLAEIDSSPGDGTTVSVRFPLETLPLETT
jgi:signal transduction histidine kinase